MSAAELNKKKLDLIAWINRLRDEDTIDFLDSFKKSMSTNDWWDSLSEDKKIALQNGMDDVDNGAVVPSKLFWDQLKNG